MKGDSERMTSAAESLREVMRLYPQGVAVVTADPGEGGARGITVSSFMSLSLEPPWVLVSIIQTAQAHAAIEAAGGYVVNILGEEQGALSEHFAIPGLSTEEQFARVSYHPGASGAPVLDDCLAYLDCRLVDTKTLADHTLFVGEVMESKVVGSGRPLVFFSRQYWGLGTEVFRRV